MVETILDVLDGGQFEALSDYIFCLVCILKKKSADDFIFV